MKTIKFISILIVTLLFSSCVRDSDIFDIVESIDAPTNISADFFITQDNTGLVKITPNGEGVTQFEIYFEADNNEFATIGIGESVERTYSEGNYQVKIVGLSLNGNATEVLQPLVVSFLPPENLVATIENDPTNNFQINVSATADYATMFEVYFGDVENEEATPLMVDETISHVYEEIGVYDVTVIAISGIDGAIQITETVSILNPLQLPIDFEDASLDYSFVDFGNVISIVVDNPDISDNNQSLRVGQTTKPANAEVWGGSYLELDDPIDFSSLVNLGVNVWSPQSGIIVKLKVENATNPDIFYESDLVINSANVWEELNFDFSSADLTQEYHKVVIFFDFGSSGTDATYYFDDIKLVQSDSEVFESFEDFEGAAPIFTEFGNIGSTQVISNPNPGGINNTDNTAQLDNAVGSEVWGGTFFELTNQVIDFAGVKRIRFKSYSPFEGKVVKLKLENADASVTHEVDMMTSVANSWELLTYDFIDAPDAQYTRVVVFYDFGNVGDGSLYLFDEMEVGEGALVSTSPPTIIEDFEGVEPAFIEFGGIEPPLVIPNPDVSGINTTATSVSQLKTSGSQTWAGSFFEVESPLDLNNYNNISVMTNVPSTGAVIKLKLENADASIVHEVDLLSTVSNEWEQLVYDFSDAPAADYTRIVIFFDFGNPGDDSIYYYDEFQLTN
tara:strand:- start:1136 stop:3163 length:2028 start_codon:yes stop_codon:yes gene_type:complete